MRLSLRWPVLTFPWKYGADRIWVDSSTHCQWMSESLPSKHFFEAPLLVDQERKLLAGLGLSVPRGQTHLGTVWPYIYPLLTPVSRGTCVSLGGPGSMHSFSEWEKLLQTRYTCTTQSVVCAIMWQLARPMGFPYLLAICWHHPLAKQTASHHHMAQPDSYFPAWIILARIWVELSGH